MNLETNIREIQKGILQWYPFREGAKCLYIGEETDAVYEMLTDPENDRIRGLFVRCVKPEELGDFAHQEEYDYIIFDTPPIGVVSDALLLKDLVAGFVVVIRERSTTHGDVQNLMESAKLADSKLLGFVKVGCIKAKRRSRRGYYYYQYY
jgi:cellulose biosynthesis protein BcsQ